MKKSIQLYYTLLQSMYWIAIGLTFSFASVYLQSRGLPNGQIGLVLAGAYVLSTLLQPTIASIIDRWQIPLAKGVVVVYGLAALLAIVLYAVPLPVYGILLLMAVDFALFFSLQSSVNSLERVLAKINYPVNFGAARGTCSLIFAVMMVVVGQVLRKVSPLFLPLSYAAVGIVSMVLLLSFRPLLQGQMSVRVEKTGGFPTAREFPAFWIFLGAAICLAIGQNFYSSFLLQIMQNVGGDSGNMGIASGINAAVEFLPMLFYSRLSKRFGVSRLMILAGWAWIAKAFCMFIAASPTGVCCAHLFQCITYALYVPGSIELVSRMLPESYFLKGQSLAVSAYTVGSVVASVFGGVLLDRIGVTGTLGIIVATVSLGAVLMTAANLKQRKCQSIDRTVSQ